MDADKPGPEIIFLENGGIFYIDGTETPQEWYDRLKKILTPEELKDLAYLLECFDP